MTKKISGNCIFPLIFHRLQSALLLVSCTRATVLRTDDIEVDRQEKKT
jgi:hypothetical protein